MDPGRGRAGHPGHRGAAHRQHTRRLALGARVQVLPRRTARRRRHEHLRRRADLQRLRPDQSRQGQAAGPGQRWARDQAGDDRGLRRRQRHASRLPCGAERRQHHHPLHLHRGRPEQHAASVSTGVRRGRAVGLRAVRLAGGALEPLHRPAPEAAAPRLHDRGQHPLQRHLRAEPDPGLGGHGLVFANRQRRLAQGHLLRTRHRRQVLHRPRRHGAGYLPDPGSPDQRPHPPVEPRQPRHQHRAPPGRRAEQHACGPDGLLAHGPDLVHSRSGVRGQDEQHHDPEAHGRPLRDVHRLGLRRHHRMPVEHPVRGHDLLRPRRPDRRRHQVRERRGHRRRLRAGAVPEAPGPGQSSPAV